MLVGCRGIDPSPAGPTGAAAARRGEREELRGSPILSKKAQSSRGTRKDVPSSFVMGDLEPPFR
jgi:hypothetical protein